MQTHLFLSILALASPVVAKDPRPIGVETVIPFAGGGNLREWQRGGVRSNGIK